MRLRDQRVVVVGCSSGIGRAVARHLAREGVRLRLVARRGDELAALAGEVEVLGGEALWHACDTTDPAQVEAALERFGGAAAVDGILYLAGQSWVTQPAAVTTQEARDLMEVNFFGLLHWLERLVPVMTARRSGFVAGCSALCAYRGIPTGEVYAATKAAMKTYLESLTLDLAPYGVQVFQLMPGFVESPMSGLNNFTQPFMIPAAEAAAIVVRGLREDRPRIEFGRGMSRLMRLLDLLPDWAYQGLLAGFCRRRHDAEQVLASLPPFLDPASGAALEWDRYGGFRSPSGDYQVRFWRDSLEVLEDDRKAPDAARDRLTAAYRLYAVTYPVTAFLAMTLVWRGRLGPLVEHYAETLRRVAATGRPLLDVAIGDGALTRLALGRARVAPTLLAVDLSPDMVRKAVRRLQGHRRKLFYVHDVGTLNMPAGSFGHIACYGGFHVFPDPAGAMASMARLLAPEGELAGSILTRPPERMGAWLSDRFMAWGQLSNSMTLAQVEAVFHQAGLALAERRWNGHMLLFRARARPGGSGA